MLSWFDGSRRRRRGRFGPPKRGLRGRLFGPGHRSRRIEFAEEDGNDDLRFFLEMGRGALAESVDSDASGENDSIVIGPVDRMWNTTDQVRVTELEETDAVSVLNFVLQLADLQLSLLPEWTTTEEQCRRNCNVCLEAYKAGSPVRALPCLHFFHKKCIDTWLLAGKNTCPVCKYKVSSGISMTDSSTKFVDS
ncbi:hypothetical protein NDN08_005504 [Rhodosorus marinus]|uniref:RING-type domain-containing protein n=1 Tax=Rhodosorus marinus TaxID=101924 RepID=A0AAV8V2N6_9RHOD|nr:hypothetical protein NDN08_005504 [Rhodosorus marinus]